MGGRAGGPERVGARARVRTPAVAAQEGGGGRQASHPRPTPLCPLLPAHVASWPTPPAGLPGPAPRVQRAPRDAHPSARPPCGSGGPAAARRPPRPARSRARRGGRAVQPLTARWVWRQLVRVQEGMCAIVVRQPRPAGAQCTSSLAGLCFGTAAGRQAGRQGDKGLQLRCIRPDARPPLPRCIRPDASRRPPPFPLRPSALDKSRACAWQAKRRQAISQAHLLLGRQEVAVLLPRLLEQVLGGGLVVVFVRRGEGGWGCRR